jgi:hypothetical protein
MASTRMAEEKVLGLSSHREQLQSRMKREVMLVSGEVGWYRELLKPRSCQGDILAYFVRKYDDEHLEKWLVRDGIEGAPSSSQRRREDCC